MTLFSAAMGQGVVWYTGQFYAMSFMKTIMNVDSDQVDSFLGVTLLFGTPFFVLFGWLSDRVGRKYIMLGGMLIALLAYRPIYKSMYGISDLDQKTEVFEKTSTVASVKLHEAVTDSIYTVKKEFTDGTTIKDVITVKLDENGIPKIKDGNKVEFHKKTIHLISSDKWKLTFLIFIQVLFVTMVYGPIAAFLVEMFPVKIRYTSMSLPYHVGNGIFGGLLPAVSTYLVTSSKLSGNPEYYLQGLWYPIIIAGVCFIIGALYISSKNKYE